MVNKEFKIYSQEGTMRMTDEEIKKQCPKIIGVLFGSNCYGRSIKDINELLENLRKLYPNVKDEDIEVWDINRSQSIRHVGFTMLWFDIPTEDYIKLREERKIFIL